MISHLSDPFEYEEEDEEEAHADEYCDDDKCMTMRFTQEELIWRRESKKPHDFLQFNIGLGTSNPHQMYELLTIVVLLTEDDRAALLDLLNDHRSSAKST